MEENNKPIDQLESARPSQESQQSISPEEQTFREILLKVGEMKRRELTDATILRRLTNEGYPADQVNEAMEVMSASIKKNSTGGGGVGQLILGIVMIIAGIGITAATDGQRLFYGLIIVGLVTMIQGIVKMANN